MTKFAFTDLAIKALKTPHAEQEDYQDATQRGFGLRIYRSGLKQFYCRYRFAGKIQRLELGNYPDTSLSTARRNAVKARLMVEEGYNPKRHKTFGYELPPEPGTPEAAARAHALLLKPLIDQYLNEACVERNNSPGTIAEKKQVLLRVANATWPAKTLPEIKPSHIKDLLKSISKSGQYSLANKTHAYLKNFFNWTVDAGFAETSPCDRIKKPHEPAKRERYLKDDEIRAVWNVAEQHAFPFGYITQLALLTAQRRNEVAHMKWSEINIKDKTWDLPGTRTKNGHENIIPLSDAALQLLIKIKYLQNHQPLPSEKRQTAFIPPKPGYHPLRSDFVFPSMHNPKRPCSGISNAKKRMARDAKFSDWRIHDLRRTVTTHLSRLGVPQPVKKRILNHTRKADVTDIYDVFEYINERRAALQLWADTLKTIVETKPETMDDLAAQFILH